jgi:hypothetical protein
MVKSKVITLPEFYSKSDLLYDWQFTANQLVLVPSPLRPTTSILFFQLNTYCHSPYVTSSLMSGWVCGLKLLLALASAVILGSKPRRTHYYILLSQIWDSPTCRARYPIYIPQEQGGPIITQGTGLQFSPPHTSRRAMVEVFAPASTRGPEC